MIRFRMVAGILGTLIAVAVAFAMLDWPVLLRAFAQLSFGALAAAAVLSLLTTLVLSLRWAVLAAPADRNLGRREFRDALVAHVFNLVTPAAAGADVYRVIIAGDRGGGRGRAASLVVLERLLGIAGYALVFLLCFAVVSVDRRNLAVFSAAAPAFAVAAALPLIPMFLARLISARSQLPAGDRIPEGLKAALAGLVGVSPKRGIAALGLSILGAMIWLACFVVVASAVGVGIDRATVGMSAIVAEFSRLLPISVQGIGVREATFAFLAAKAGGSFEAAFAACATAYALHFALIAFVAFTARCGILPRVTNEMRQLAAQFLRGVQ